MAQTSRDSLRFPCTFPLKVIGKQTEEFAAQVIEIVQRHVPDYDGAVTTRLSSGGTYLAVTVSIVAQSREQLDALYRGLQEHEQVLRLL